MYEKVYYTYIMSNIHRTVLYIGMTNSLDRRTVEHRIHINKKSFTARYNVSVLLHFEEFDTPREAIAREKQLKGWTRKRKIDLIKIKNPQMHDLLRD